MKRPTGITVLAIFALLGGLGELIAFIVAVAAGFVATAEVLPGQVAIAIVAGLFALISGVVLLAFAVGAWSLKPWAWTLGMLSVGLWALSNLINVGRGAFAGNVVVIIIIAALVIWYLYRPHVRAAFGK
jgi:hypothetical protein